MKVICSHVREDCEGCRHAAPHEPWADIDISVTVCSEAEEECAFHQLATVKCVPTNLKAEDRYKEAPNG